MTSEQATTEEIPVLVLKDEAGEYYLLPREALERGRVPVEEKAKVEQQIAGSDDVVGYAPVNVGLVTGALYISAGAQLIGEGAQGGDPIGGLQSIATGLEFVAQGIVIGMAGLGRPPVRL